MYLRIQCPTRIKKFKNLDVKVWVQPGYGDRNRRQHEDRRLGHNLTNAVLLLVPADDNNRKWSIRERSGRKVISWKNSTATGIIKYHPREGLKDLNEWLIQRRHTSHSETCVCVRNFLLTMMNALWHPGSHLWWGDRSPYHQDQCRHVCRKTWRQYTSLQCYTGYWLMCKLYSQKCVKNEHSTLEDCIRAQPRFYYRTTKPVNGKPHVFPLWFMTDNVSSRYELEEPSIPSFLEAKIPEGDLVGILFLK